MTTEKYYLIQANTNTDLEKLSNKLRVEFFKTKPKRRHVTELKDKDLFVIAEQYKINSMEAFLVYHVTGNSFSQSRVNNSVSGTFVDLSLEVRTTDMALIDESHRMFYNSLDCQLSVIEPNSGDSKSDKKARISVGYHYPKSFDF